MSIHISKMDEQGKLDWLRAYEKQNPAKYLRKYGKVTEKDPMGQPIAWDYVPPEEAIKSLKPSFSFSKVLGVKVDVAEKEKVVVEQKFVQTPVPPQAEVKRGRPKNV